MPMLLMAVMAMIEGLELKIQLLNGFSLASYHLPIS